MQELSVFAMIPPPVPNPVVPCCNRSTVTHTQTPSHTSGDSFNSQSIYGLDALSRFSCILVHAFSLHQPDRASEHQEGSSTLAQVPLSSSSETSIYTKWTHIHKSNVTAPSAFAKPCAHAAPNPIPVTTRRAGQTAPNNTGAACSPISVISTWGTYEGDYPIRMAQAGLFSAGSPAPIAFSTEAPLLPLSTSRIVRTIPPIFTFHQEPQFDIHAIVCLESPRCNPLDRTTLRCSCPLSLRAL
ncbi:hypothetical protein FIBSPDRAFT_948409 [Athelia psychrophila]|uniref:Uncharacterized protein n=1 Tax=Athelia psychrophila TaxID=1759441 RepID=A0A166QS40_9AGAM|nr:hypothetical protein FIBSPDRAFT_948409 [Fibularhizoctonia sp. CBS 109695]